MRCAGISPVDCWFDRYPAGLVLLSEFLSAEPCQVVLGADRDGMENLSGSEPVATFHARIYDVSR